VEAFGYWHLVLLLGVIAVAAAEKTVVAQPLDGLGLAEAVALGGGVAVYLVGDVLFRRSLAIGAGGRRAVAALVALATIPLALVLAVLQLAGLVVVLAAMFVAEARAVREPVLAR
jgi:low temperature requirement protein LtrA